MVEESHEPQDTNITSAREDLIKSLKLFWGEADALGEINTIDPKDSSTHDLLKGEIYGRLSKSEETASKIRTYSLLQKESWNELVSLAKKLREHFPDSTHHIFEAISDLSLLPIRLRGNEHPEGTGPTGCVINLETGEILSHDFDLDISVDRKSQIARMRPASSTMLLHLATSSEKTKNPVEYSGIYDANSIIPVFQKAIQEKSINPLKEFRPRMAHKPLIPTS